MAQGKEVISSKEKRQSGGKESTGEKLSRWGRNFNAFVGAVALAGSFVAPPVVAAGLGIYAGLNFAQAGGFEALRRRLSKSKRRQAA